MTDFKITHKKKSDGRRMKMRNYETRSQPKLFLNYTDCNLDIITGAATKSFV